MALKLTLWGETHELEIVRRRPHLVVRIDGRAHEIAALGDPRPGRHELTIDGEPFRFVRTPKGDASHLRVDGRTYEVGHIDPRSEAEASGAVHDEIRAPMPGAVVSVHKTPGDPVTRGEAVVTIESMKLQTALVAPRDGVVKELVKEQGQSFDKDAVLVRLEPNA